MSNFNIIPLFTNSNSSFNFSVVYLKMIKGIDKVKIVLDINLNDRLGQNTFLDLMDFCVNDIKQDSDIYLDTKGENECLWRIDFK